jgi:PAS domain-containing protein
MIDPDQILARVAPLLTSSQRAGVVVQDSHGAIVGYNAAALDVLAMSEGQLLGLESRDARWEAVDAAMRPLTGDEHPAMRVVRSGRELLGEVMGVRVGNGEYRWLVVDSWPTEPAGFGGVVSQFTDITAELDARSRLGAALERLQRHALPNRQVEIAGMRVHVRYRSAGTHLDMGGDFLDIFPVDDRRHRFFIGDAAGHDLDTVATTVVAHHTLRAASLHIEQPGRALTWLHNTLLATPDTVFCSAIQGTVTTRPGTDGGIEVHFANAGHPAPLHIGPHGVRGLEEHGMLLGALDMEAEPPTVAVDLRPGDQMIFYTDGLIESLEPRMSPEALGARCASAGARGDSVIDVVDDLIAQAMKSHDHRDDIAVLVFDLS